MLWGGGGGVDSRWMGERVVVGSCVCLFARREAAASLAAEPHSSDAQQRPTHDVQAQAQALATLDARLGEEQRARESAQSRLAASEARATALAASVQALGQERREAERKYEARLGSERNLRLQEQGEWQRRVDRVRGLMMEGLGWGGFRWMGGVIS